MFTDDELREDDDLDALLAEDPDLRIGADEDIEDEPSEDEEEQPKKKPASDPIDNETRQLLADLKAERKLAAQKPPEQHYQPPAPPQPQAPAFDEDKAAADFEAAILADPKSAFKQVFALVKGVAQAQQAQTEQNISRVASGSADAAVDRYMEGVRNGPRMDNEVQEEMERLIERAKSSNGAAIARMSRAQIVQALDEAKAQAYGTVALRRGNTRPKSAPAPKYGGSGGNRPSAARPTLTPDERGFIRGLRDALPGITDKDLQKELRDYRREVGRAS